MSAPLAGKFQDHYEILSVDPKADSDAIQRAYTKLAQQYHPNNPDTGNQEKFEAVNLAFEILSDPLLRPEFDKVKGIGADEGPPRFSGLDFFDSLGRETGLRLAFLCLLYDRRRNKPYTPSLSIRHIEGMLIATAHQMNFAQWYLKQRSLVAADDKSSLQITIAGIDYLEANRPSPEAVMPFIRATAMAALDAPADAVAETIANTSSTIPPQAITSPLPMRPTMAPPTMTPPALRPAPSVPSGSNGSVIFALNRSLARAELHAEEVAEKKS